MQFGEARGKNKEALINLGSNAAEVVLTFVYEENTYRVQRSLPRGKSQIYRLKDIIFIILIRCDYQSACLFKPSRAWVICLEALIKVETE